MTRGPDNAAQHPDEKVPPRSGQLNECLTHHGFDKVDKEFPAQSAHINVAKLTSIGSSTQSRYNFGINPSAMFVPNTTSRPPADMAIPHTEQLIFTIATQIPFVIFFGMGIRNLAVKGDPRALLFGIGGCLASAFEPIVDILGFCYFPREGNWVAFETFGRPIPAFVPATYGWFVGGMGYWCWNVFQNPKTTARDIPVLWFKAFIINLVLEYPPLYYGIYTYYGYQPLVVGGFPLWFPAVNATSPMVAGTIISLITPYLGGIKDAVIVTVTATSYGIANAAFGAPVWMALSVDKGYHVTYPAVGISALLLSLGVWIMSLQFSASGSIKLKEKGFRG